MQVDETKSIFGCTASKPMGIMEMLEIGAWNGISTTTVEINFPACLKFTSQKQKKKGYNYY